MSYTIVALPEDNVLKEKNLNDEQKFGDNQMNE